MESKEFTARIISLSDMDVLQKVGKETFYDSFIDITPPDDMKAYLNSSFSSDVLQTELEDEQSKYYFLELGDVVVGYGKINFDKAPYGMMEIPHSMEIQRIYIKKEFQRMGAARKLMHVFFDEAKRRKCNSIWLSTGSFNNHALSFYKKYGFEKIGNHEFPVGGKIFEDVILLLKR